MGFSPVIIDFGKTRKISKVEGHRKEFKFPHLAPEVLRGHKPSVASDIYYLDMMKFGLALNASVYCSECKESADAETRLALASILGPF